MRSPTWNARDAIEVNVDKSPKAVIFRYVPIADSRETGGISRKMPGLPKPPFKSYQKIPGEYDLLSLSKIVPGWTMTNIDQL